MVSLGFEGHTELFHPRPFTWKTPAPPEDIRTPEFGFVLLRLFPCLKIQWRLHTGTADFCPLAWSAMSWVSGLKKLICVCNPGGLAESHFLGRGQNREKKTEKIGFDHPEKLPIPGWRLIFRYFSPIFWGGRILFFRYSFSILPVANLLCAHSARLKVWRCSYLWLCC